MPVSDAIKTIGHTIGWLVPGINQEQSMQTANNLARRQGLNSAINQAIQRETNTANWDPNDTERDTRVASLLDMQRQIQAQHPFDDPKKFEQMYGQYLSLHPMHLQPRPQQPQPVAKPGPAMQGQPNGQPNITIPSVEQMTGGVVGNGIPSVSPPPTSAAPGTSLVQPPQQKGGGAASTAQSSFPQLPEPPSISGVGDTGDQSDPASFSIDANRIGPTPEIQLPTLPDRPLPRLPWTGNTLTPEDTQAFNQLTSSVTQLAHPAVQAQAAADQALAVLRSTAEFNNANNPHKVEMIKNMIGKDQWAATPDLIKTGIISSAMGVNIPGIAGMFAAPQKEFVDANRMSSAEKRQLGIPETATGDYTVLRNRLGQVVGAFPGRSKLAMAMDAYGREYITDQEALAPGSPIPAGPNQAYNPAALAPKSTTQQQPTPGGGVQTTRTEEKQIATNPPPAATGTPASTPAPVSMTGPTAPKKNTPLSDVTVKVDTFGRPISPVRKSQIDNAVKGLLTENMSNAQMNERIKLLEGSDKWLADQVRARFSVVDQQPAMAWDLPMAQRAQFSNQALTHMDNINALIDKLDKDGKLGPIMSRWEDFMLGKVGAGDPDYAKLRNQIHLMSTALGNVHGGARGGGSIQMYQAFSDKLNAARMDAESLRAAMSVEKEWLTTYANPSKTTGVQSPNNPITSIGGNKAKVWDEKTQSFK